MQRKHLVTLILVPAILLLMMLAVVIPVFVARRVFPTAHTAIEAARSVLETMEYRTNVELAREVRLTAPRVRVTFRLEGATARRRDDLGGAWEVSGTQIVEGSNGHRRSYPFQCLLVWGGDGRYRYEGEIEESGRRLLGDGRLYPRRESPAQDARFLNQNDD